MEWNFDLEAAKGHGSVLLVGTNNCDGSRWWNEAVLTDDGWFDHNLEPIDFSNATPKAWAVVKYPEM